LTARYDGKILRDVYGSIFSSCGLVLLAQTTVKGQYDPLLTFLMKHQAVVVMMNGYYPSQYGKK